MVSSFERFIDLLPAQSRGRPLDRFINHFDDVKDLLNLRATSKKLRDSNQINRKAFKTIYVHAPCHGEQDVDALATLSPLCRNLIIKLAFPHVRKTKVSRYGTQGRMALTNALRNRIRRIQEDHERERRHTPEYKAPLQPEFPSPTVWKYVLQRRPDQVDPAQLAHWHHLLSLFPNIVTLIISCNGDPGWSGCTDIEMCLIQLRVCIERVNFRNIRTVSLNPIHACGIIHFRWAGFGAYGEANGVGPSSSGQLNSMGMPWQRLERLDLCIRNPFHEGRMDGNQKEVFADVLADYLRSFKPTLKVLKFDWVGGIHGPNPLMLSASQDTADVQRGSANAWAKLEELWLGNVPVDRNAVNAIRACAPVMQKLMVFIPQPDGGAGGGGGANEGGSVTPAGPMWRDVLRTEHISPVDSEVSSISDASRSIPIRLG